MSQRIINLENCRGNRPHIGRHPEIHDQDRRNTHTYPGEVLLRVDHTGSGHKWPLINDEPWKRAYVIFKPCADTYFVPDRAEEPALK